MVSGGDSGFQEGQGGPLLQAAGPSRRLLAWIGRTIAVLPGSWQSEELMERHTFLKSWREAFGLSPARVAARAGLSVDELEGIESGAVDPSVDELEHLGRALGLRPEALYEAEVPATAGPDSIRLLLKSTEAFRPGEELRLRMLDAARAAVDLLDLQAELHLERSRIDRFQTSPLTAVAGEPLHSVGERLARQVRQELHLTGPIRSIRNLVGEQLGVPLVAADLTPHGPDAFTLYAPARRAAIVVNVAGKNQNKLVARFSIAHELCHLLFDRPAAGSLGIACHTDPRHALEGETRANAFAMRLLLPERELQKLDAAIFQPDVFREVMEHWGVHYSALRLYVEKLRGLSAEEAERDLPAVDTTCPLLLRDAEELPAERETALPVPWPRRGVLLALALDAHRRGQINRSRLRELLHLDATESIEQLGEVLDLPASVPAE